MPPSPNDKLTGTGRPPRILVADDHAINRMLALRQLQALGFLVDTVKTGREAVEAMKVAPYDLVFMDCHMSGMDGFEATREIRRHEGAARRTPIVALTASVTDRHLCLTAGMDDFSLKPVSQTEMLRLVRRWIFEVGTPPIDAAKIELLRQTSAGLVGELVEIYIDDAPARIAAIRDAVTRRDAPALASSAHALRGSSGNVGATRVLSLCAKLEDIGRAGGTDGAADLVEDLTVEYERATRALRELQPE